MGDYRELKELIKEKIELCASYITATSAEFDAQEAQAVENLCMSLAVLDNMEKENK